MIDTTKLRDGDMPLLGRIDAALRRVISGDGLMRIPAEATDPDIVLAECKREIERLRSENDSLRAAILNALPGVRYMDPPDGGGPSIAEQLLRMAEDAERYLWLRENTYGTAPEPTPLVPHVVHVNSCRDWRDALDAAIDAAMKEEK